ncbi:MAG: hypothetical protein ACPLRA_07445, partial [Candidatus Saccharicenans sp.]
MIFYAYPRLPPEIPYWLNLAGQTVMKAPKGPLLFLYPLTQSLFFTAFWLGAKIWIKMPENSAPELTQALKNLKKELALLLLIFFNLIFIHI